MPYQIWTSHSLDLSKMLCFAMSTHGIHRILCSQDEVTPVPKSHKKHKEKTIDASLFDDNVDIFADLTDTLKPKQKSKVKGETKSIFDDDMGKYLSPFVLLNI